MQNLVLTTEEQLEARIQAAVQRGVEAAFKLQHSQSPNEQRDEIGGIDLAVKTTGYAKPTIYSLVSKRRIPHSKPSGKRLIFNRQELLDWLQSNKRRTVSEIKAEAMAI